MRRKDRIVFTRQEIKLRIEDLRKSLEYLQGKTPKDMKKAEYLHFYMTNARICELQDLIGEE
jgi:hypothetical protein